MKIKNGIYLVIGVAGLLYFLVKPKSSAIVITKPLSPFKKYPITKAAMDTVSQENKREPEL